MGQPLEFYPGQTYAPMSDYTSSGMTAATDFLNGPYQQVFNQATGNMSDLSNLMDVANNSYVQGMNETLAKRLQGNARQSIGDFTSSMNKALSGGMYNLNRGLRLDPNNYYLVAHQGWHYVQAGELRRALGYFEKSLDLKPGDNPIAWHYRNILHARLQEAATAQPGSTP